MDNRSTKQPAANNAITSDMSSMVLNKTPEISTENLAGEKSPLTDMPCINIPFKSISASEQAQVNVSLTIKDSLNKTESQLSQAQPVSLDLLQRLQTQLTACYTETSFVNKRLFDTDYFSLGDYFVNLQMVVKADETNEVTQSNDDKYSHKPLRERDRLAGEKKAIVPSKLFQLSAYQDANGKSPASIDTVVVSGAAGVGKTTLVDYIAYQWALFKQSTGKEGLWSDFETVLIVRCRDLQPDPLGPGTQVKDIVELLRYACWGPLDIHLDEARQLLTTLKSAPESCLLLLDGLDELPVPKKTYWRNLLVQLFQLPFKKLVTTRPYAISNLQQWLSHDGLVEIQGFSDEDVPTFFKKHLGATERTNNFIKGIKRNPDLWAIVHIPINAYLLKIWWKTTCQQDKPVLLREMSVSHLYESLMVNVCRRYLAKIGELDENKLLDDEMVLEIPSIRCLLDTLGCWAFEGLKRDSVQLPISWLKGVQNSDESPTLLSANRLKQLNVPALKALGLLKQVGRAIEAQQIYEFLHLSFQEFLAAKVITVTLRQDKEKQKTHLTQVIHRYKYHPNFTLVWPSVAGLLSRYPAALNDFLSILVAGPKDWLGILEFDLLMRCLESSLPSSIDTNALGLRQQTLLRAVKRRIKRLNKLPQALQWTTINTLHMCPRLIRLNNDTVWAFLRDETVKDFVRGNLARSAVTHLSSTPEFVDAVSALLRDETVKGSVRGNLAINAVTHLSQTPELVGAVLASLRDETISGFLRSKLAIRIVAHLLQIPELVDALWAFLRDEKVSKYVRCDLTSSAVAHLSQTPEFVDAVWAFFRDEQVDRYVRGALASSTVAHWSQTPELVDTVLAFLRDVQMSGYVRCKLASSAAAHFSQTPELVGTVLAFLRDVQMSGYVRCKLASSAAAHFSQTPELVDAIWVFLRDEQVGIDVRCKLAEVAVAHLSQTPEFVDKLWAFLRDKTVSDYVRTTLGINAVAHLSQTQELMDTVWALLRDVQMSGYFRSTLARKAVAHWSQTPELVDVVWALLRDEKVNASVRCKLARRALAHFSQTPELVDVVWALLRDEKVNDSVRCKLARSVVAHLPPIPQLMDAVWALLRDEQLYRSFRCKLARGAVEHLPPTPELADVVSALLRDEKTLSRYVRGKLAESAGAHLSQTPECLDAVLALLRDGKVSNHVRGYLARSAAQQLPKWPNKVQAFLDSLFVKDSVGEDLSQRADIPVHLLLPLYKKTHSKGRQYIRKQLVKYGVLVYEQAGTVLVTQAGQTEKLTLPPPLIQKIQKDLQSYRISIDNSVSTLSKLNLFSKSVMSFFSSQHTEKRSSQTSCSNTHRVT